MRTIIHILLWLSCVMSLRAQVAAGPLSISPEAKDLIVRFETGGRSYYESRLKRPTWPGGASGVTIGIGYDCGYNTRAGIIKDWSRLPKASRDALAAASGVKGQRAKIMVSSLRWIVVPWPEAEEVFVSNSMQRFGGYTSTAFPGVIKTHSHIQGALLSIVFNRGASMADTPSRREMRSIRTHVQTGNLRHIPAEIRSMKRLWIGKGLDGLLTRRDAEAALVDRALADNGKAVSPNPKRSLWFVLTRIFRSDNEHP